MEQPEKIKQPLYIILLLVLSGEAIFILPFVLARVFRPTFLEAFQLDNTTLGYCFSVYGIVAVIAYFFGGALADRFQPRVLMSVGLISTALGGFYMSTFPDPNGLKWLFGYWGFTTIFLFWAAMIKATRIWGGQSRQVRAFGLLEAGRGMVAATMGLVCVFIFTAFLSTITMEIGFEERRYALQNVIQFLSGFVVLVGILVLLFLKTKHQNEPKEKTSRAEKKALFLKASKVPAVWFLMIIVLCAYVGYKVTSIIPQHANEIVGFTEVESAQVGTFLLYIRPFAALLVIFLAIRFKASYWMVVGFAVMLFGAIFFATGILEYGMYTATLVSIFVISTGIYAVRALYFALMQEGEIPLAVTGTAIGLISVVGYLPDIFMPPLIGIFLDNYPGETGYQLVFGTMAVFSLIGLAAVVLFRRHNDNRVEKVNP